jgi:hypothetical protein
MEATIPMAENINMTSPSPVHAVILKKNIFIIIILFLSTMLTIKNIIINY